MNRDDLIRMAREAGMRVGTNLSGVVLVGSPAEIGLAHLTIEELERCAALVAAAAKAEEREACAKVCEGRIGGAVQTNEWWNGFKAAMKQCAAAIRARRNK